MSQDIYAKGKEPVRIWWNGDGTLMGAHAIATDAHKGLIQDPDVFRDLRLPGLGDDVRSEMLFYGKSKGDQPATTSRPDVQVTNGPNKIVMVTTDGAELPNEGYLVALSSESPTGLYQCIQVKVAGRDRDNIALAAGFGRVFVSQFPVVVSTKQTPHMRWLQDVWDLAAFAGEEKPSRDIEDLFSPLRTIAPTAVGADLLAKVLIFLWWDHWRRFRTPDEARVADLRRFGLHSSGRSALQSKIERMKLKRM